MLSYLLSSDVSQVIEMVFWSSMFAFMLQFASSTFDSHLVDPVQSWPSGTVQLPVHLDSAINGAAGGTYQESPLSQPQQISTDLTIPADNPLFQLQIPGVQATVVVQVAAAGLSWWVHAGSVGQVPSSLHPQGGSTVTLSRLAPVPYVIPAGSVVSTAFDPAA